jgi:uncharacterized membrane protein YfhO
VFLDTYYPGWRATVDGEDARILLADDGFKAVAVPAGDHVVVFTFSSPALHLGTAITLVTALASAAGLVLLRRKDRLDRAVASRSGPG